MNKAKSLPFYGKRDGKQAKCVKHTVYQTEQGRRGERRYVEGRDGMWRGETVSGGEGRYVEVVHIFT